MTNSATNPKTSTFNRSGYPRIEGDDYPTIDRRCAAALIDSWPPPQGPVLDPCAANGSPLLDAIAELRNDACVTLPTDATRFQPPSSIRSVISNPPYKRGTVDAIIRQLTKLYEQRRLDYIALLMRTNFASARGLDTGRGYFVDTVLSGMIVLRFRPIWFTPRAGEKNPQPQHNFCWLVADRRIQSGTEKRLLFWPQLAQYEKADIEK